MKSLYKPAQQNLHQYFPTCVDAVRGDKLQKNTLSELLEIKKLWKLKTAASIHKLKTSQYIQFIITQDKN